MDAIKIVGESPKYKHPINHRIARTRSSSIHHLFMDLVPVMGELKGLRDKGVVQGADYNRFSKN